MGDQKAEGKLLERDSKDNPVLKQLAAEIESTPLRQTETKRVWCNELDDYVEIESPILKKIKAQPNRFQKTKDLGPDRARSQTLAQRLSRSSQTSGSIPEQARRKLIRSR